MTSEQFMANFGHIASAPGGIGRLRDLIYHFAFAGELVAHSKETAADLAGVLAKAESPTGRTRRAMLEPAAGFYPIPAHWLWVNIGDVGHDWGQTKPSEDFTYIDVSAIDNQRGIVAEGASIVSAANAPSRARKVVKMGTVIYSTVRPYLLNIAIIERDFDPPPIASTAFAILHPHDGVEAKFVYYFLRSPAFVAYVESVQSGIAYPAISDQKFFAASFPLAPTEEQQRIVAKVDELMALCDKLEELIMQRRQLFPALSRACNTSLIDKPSPTALRLIFDEVGSVSTKDLRRTVLSMAVQGKLIKFSDCNLGAKVGDHIDFLNGYAFKSEWFKPSGHKLCRNVNIGHGVIDWRELACVDDEVAEQFERFRLHEGDIVLSLDRPLISTGLKVARVRKEDLPCLLLQRVAKPVPKHDRLDLSYFYLWLNSPEFVDSIDPGRSNGVPHISTRQVEKMNFPLPPLTEQRRIVAKVDELMALVDTLEQQQTRSEDLASAYVQSLVTTLTGKEFEPKTEKMNKQFDEEFEERIYPKQPHIPFSGFVIKEVKLLTGYRSLGKTDFEFHNDIDRPETAAPICLVGLNGSGKSNLLEAIADIFCYLELINLPWNSIPDKYQSNDHKFVLTYVLQEADSLKRVKIAKGKKKGADFFVVSENGEETTVTDPLERISLLPRRIIGYSSGLNETLSHPFLRTRTMYSEEVQKAAPPNGVTIKGVNPVFNTRSLYMDYENNAEILICNSIFRTPKELSFIKEYTRVEGISKFSLTFQRKIAGKSGDAAIARLTNELKEYLRKFALCAGKEVDVESDGPHHFKYTLDRKTKESFKKHFKSAEGLFLAMYKWSLLNALVLSKEQRNVFLKEDVTKGTLERPPVVPPKERLFDVSDVKVTLSQPKIEIDYSGLSDGEHQFVQVFGTILLFNEPGSLFLLDEPESHFNPEWRTKFNSILNKLPNANTHEFMISTHSPYLVSGSREENVYKFERHGAKVSCKSVKFETYGASFDDLLNKLFSIKSLIDVSAREELETILKAGNLEELEKAVGDFAESDEKRRLYEAILRKRKKN